MGLLFLQLMNYTERVQVGEQYFEQEMLLGVYRYIEEHYREGSLSELAEELHRKVTTEELMEETGMSRKMIEDAIRMSGFKIEDIDNNAKDSL